MNNQIDLTQFLNAVELLKTRIAFDALRELSFTSKSMYSSFSVRLVILILIEIYLVMGLSLFSDKDDFINLILNTILPILVGVVLLTFSNLERIKSKISKLR